MFTISETSGIKTKLKKGFYSGSKQIKKDLGIHNSMEALNNMIHPTKSNGGLPLKDTYTCSRIEVLADGTERKVPVTKYNLSGQCLDNIRKRLREKGYR
tara:strand:+ start:819 stop:1115 length:297 start_codon:yes stop_codon:yes gene_type:complete